MKNHNQAALGYGLVGLVAVALLVGGLTGDTSDTGDGIGMAIFGALFLSASVSGLLGVLAGSAWHLAWAFTDLMFPVYSLPFLLFAGLRGSSDRARAAEEFEPAPAGSRPGGAGERAIAEQREDAAHLAALVERLRRLHADSPEEFRRLPAYKSCRRFVAEYERYGLTAEVVALAEEAFLETRRAVSAWVADVPNVGRRDFRGEPWTPSLRLVETARREPAQPSVQSGQ